MSASMSVPDARLGLTSSEWQMVVHQQQIALQGSHNGSMISRGRGMGRSTSSSRAASAASSQGRLLLDPDSLQALYYQLDHLLRDIRRRIEYLNEQSELSIQNTYDQAGNVIADADVEIARVRQIIASIDELEMEFDKIKRIRDIVKGFRARVETLDHRLDQASRRRR
ncbi:uncharacterized protein CIMG_10054 [Coccidioides immitis RS]|uniref:Biogenesis of lysosome-related organelles complex 1 subunit CNL1 n=6 Tax=Coccidioides TaxID=5500 RepID=J3K0Q7_COCIM|nr:uncharacterized protein CIMG_10054 [Coccidioides immitis RS]XP_003072024.1 hypothetical protein CPC735_011970 [Coccidioides posadasii C735 delta SOWgp]EFW18927.1 conserved hypothetical protein [Coccidioides posadasii str. Silveira]KMM71269.1 hypothetical protein CPAG_07576 [Coccidioides posadasii RMSCC 3488]KMP09409.1 hypothetical protein CIRG_09579 [Coccidioides immitis RMSCC 2394]KMU75342.1 hypothetical protein CISG_04761 [Coccidioides immitis RMSCC 3703]EAS27449.3 hypothetical protein C|eukprot:XP_003072024.1 hypothetical protein CPC735_011970 [Coccidioides posadasii C735 delta SOWgp]